ncbi:hypothetical protein M404DRAFT_761462 [Pisolithus tinctorius Marx 270]|uniref:Uncharacterized protein n=1 Tax=Pisolithus tinctorius Marx 270 TaxID=870435 RepID=A0A0C3NHK8_PISTI|nr:hypothetical protein M404DRAFT_761462 [Pisolithus tinctorius Marx 270]
MNRENKETRRLDQLILRYMPNCLEALWIRKRRYLDNGCAEIYKVDVPRKGSASGMNDPKSERSDTELREQLWQDLEDGPSHKNANISGATGHIRTTQISTWNICRGLQYSQKPRGATRKRARYEYRTLRMDLSTKTQISPERLGACKRAWYRQRAGIE